MRSALDTGGGRAKKVALSPRGRQSVKVLQKQASFQARVSLEHHSTQADKAYPAFTYTKFLAATFDRARHCTEGVWAPSLWLVTCLEVCKAAFRCFDKAGLMDKARVQRSKLHLPGWLGAAGAC